MQSTRLFRHSFVPNTKPYSNRIKLLVAYDGTDYAGWQRQSTDKGPTLQATLEDALSQIFNEPVKVQASGRTDAGTHSEGQIVHFNIPLNSDGTPKREPKTINKNNKLLKGLNSLTPSSLTVKRAWLAPDSFHALRSATHKTYRYVIHNDAFIDPIRHRFSYWHERPLNVQKLNELTKCLIGEHDFKSFQTGGTTLKTTVRTLISANWSEDLTNPHQQLYSTKTGKTIIFRIIGTGFLKQMVRNIVGTALYLHHNGGDASDMLKILQSHNRQSAKSTAPSTGLFLEKVYYPADLDNACLEL